VANEVKLTIKVGDDGTLNAVAREAKKAAKATDEVGKSTEKTRKSRENYSKGEKGVAGATSNSTKSFSKMRGAMTGTGGLVPAYATLAANVFALSAAFGVLQRAAQLEQLKAGFEALANTSGRTASLIVKSIQDITDGAVSADSAFRSAAAGFNAGFSTREIERLTQVAKNASQALGRNLPDSLDRLVRGTAKLEPEILDELGIFVRLEDAVQRYAQSVGKSAGELTEAERRQAFLNAALTQGELKFSSLGDSIPSNPFEQLAANFDKLAKGFLNIVSVILGPIIQVLANSTTALLGVLIIFGTTISSQIFPVLGDLGGKYRELADNASKAAAQAKAEQKDLMKQAKAGVLAETPISKTSKFAKVQEKLQRGEKISIEELKIAKRSLMDSEDSRSRNLKKYSGEQLVAKELELNAVKEQTLAVENLIAAEERRTGPQLAKAKADALGNLEGGVSKATLDIQKAGALDGFKLARQGLQDYRSDADLLNNTTAPLFVTRFGKANKVIKLLSAKLRVGSVAVRLFGTALINAIPVIGQIIFVIGLVISALKFLYNAINPPSKAMEQFGEVLDSTKEKMQQLEEANEKLRSKYYATLLAQEQSKKETKNLTAERLLEIQATAESYAAVEKYANTLKVTSGITNEFASAVDALGTELRETEPGFLGSLLDYAVQGTIDLVSAAIDGLTLAFVGLKNILMDSIIPRTLGSILEGLGSIGTKLFPELAKSIDIAPVLRKTDKFKNTVLKQFKELTETAPGAAQAITNSLGMPFEDFVEKQFSAVESMETYAQAQLEFERGSVAVSAALKQASIDTKNGSDSITKFAENVRQAGVSLQSLRNKFFQQGEYGKIADEIQLTMNAVSELQKTTNAEGSGTTFADALSLAVSSGQINLGDYGLTLEQVQERGKDAFQPLLDNFIQLDVDTRNAAENMKSLKAELANLKATASLRELQYQLHDIKEGLRLTGEASQLAGRGLDDLKDKYDNRIEDIKAEASIRKEIIDAEIDLELLKLEVLKTSTNLNEKQVALITSLEQRLEGSRTQRKGAVDTDSSGQVAQAGTSFLQEGEQLRNRLLSIAKTGDTTAERISNLGTQFQILGDKGLNSFSIVDEAGNLIGDNFTARVQAVTSALQPMIQAFADLGPEGKVAQAFAQGMVMMAESAAMLGDTIQTALGAKATSSFQEFEMAWQNASLQDKAAVAAAAFSLAANSIAALAGALKEQANAAVAKIDEQIAAEKRLDGKSANSAAKIKKLEADKEKIKRKAFETDKKLRIAQAIMSTAAGVASALTLPPPLGFIMAGLVAAMGAAQIGIISGLSYQGGGTASAGDPTQITAGQRRSSVDLAKSKSSRGELAYLRGGQGQGGPEAFTPAFTGYKNRAEGGNTAFMVGEQGPELFVPEMPGRIVANDDIAASAPTNVSFNINTIDASGVEDLLVAQRGNIIGMIRQAANSYGQDFVEGVDTSVFTQSAGGASKY